MGKNAFDFGDLFLSVVVSLLRFTESPHLGMTFCSSVLVFDAVRIWGVPLW